MKNFQADVQSHLSVLTKEGSWFDIRPLSDHVSESMANQRVTLQLLGCFALLGMVVSVLGVYSTTTLMAVSRNHETGIRLALGAQSGNVLWLALLRGLRTILIGLPIGLLLAWILSQKLSSTLFQVNNNDPLAWISSCTLLLGAAIIAALIPALRAIRVNPADALRHE